MLTYVHLMLVCISITYVDAVIACIPFIFWSVLNENQITLWLLVRLLWTTN